MVARATARPARTLLLAVVSVLWWASPLQAQSADASESTTRSDEPTAGSEGTSESSGGGDDTDGTDGAGHEDARGEDVVASFGDAIGEHHLGDEDPALGASRLRVSWRPEWPRYSFDEAVLTAGLGALLLAAELLPTAAFRPNWQGGILFDDGVREGLRLREYEQRESARVASEVLQGVLIAFPFVFDAFFVAGIGEGSWDLALQMGLISLEAYVISLVFWRVTALLARRERPVATECATTDVVPRPAHCNDRQTTQSFFSNQATNAFTGAGLICLHHTSMALWGDEGADATACVGGITVAAVVGLLRVMSDFEYLTDVLTGAVVGMVSGWLLPYLLHYQGGARPELRSPVAVLPVPMVSDTTLGLAGAGWF